MSKEGKMNFLKTLLIMVFLVIVANAQAAQVDKRFISGAFNSLLSEKTTDNLTQGSSNLYWSDTLFNSAFSGKTTDGLAQGSSNKYYATSLFNADLATKTTDNLTEGTTNKYYLLSRVQSDVLVSSIASGDSTHAPTADAVYTALSAKLDASKVGAANGVVPLNASTKIDSAYLPNGVMQYKGAWNPSTNSPSLADGTGTNGDVYRASVAGSVDLGSGSHTWQIGDFAIYNGSVWEFSPAADGVVSVNGLQGAVVLNSDSISEGATNTYFTTARARAAVSASAPLSYDSGTGALSIQQVSGSQAGYLSAAQYSALSSGNYGPHKESITLVAADITNQYADMSVECKADSMVLLVGGGPVVAEGVDYTLSVVNDKTRITFAGDLASAGATPLVAADKLYAQCAI